MVFFMDIEGRSFANPMSHPEPSFRSYAFLLLMLSCAVAASQSSAIISDTSEMTDYKHEFCLEDPGFLDVDMVPELHAAE